MSGSRSAPFKLHSADFSVQLVSEVEENFIAVVWVIIVRIILEFQVDHFIHICGTLQALEVPLGVI